MTRCAKCDKRILMGGIKACEGTYCTSACAFGDFQPRFLEALAVAAEKTPNPFPNAAPPPKPKPELADWESENAPGMADSLKDIIIIAAGLVVMALVVVVIREIHKVVQYPFYAQTFLFVFPLGAGLCGFVAGGGFWFLLRKFERLPNFLTYLAAALGGAAGFVFIYFLMWMQLEDQGVPIRDEVGFVDFLRMAIENQAIKIGQGGGKPIELGKAGYVAFVLNVLGFGLGGVVAVSVAGAKAYCKNCRRYFRTVGTQKRSSHDPETTGSSLYPVIVGIQTGRLQEAVDLHAESGLADEKAFWSSTVTLEACPGCGLHKATLTGSIQAERGPEPVTGFVYIGTVQQRVVLPG